MTQHHTTGHACRRPRTGVTMAEIVVSTLLVGLVLVASMKTVGGVVRTWQTTADQHDGMALAADLMTEVMQARYFEPDAVENASSGGGLLGDLLGLLGGGGGVPYGIDSGESSTTRAAWDDTDDYDDWSASPPLAKDGTVLTEYAGWTRAVVVQKVQAGTPNVVNPDSSSDKGLRRITVTVTAPDGTQTVLVGLRSYCGVMEHPSYLPGVEPKYVMWVGSELQIGAGSAPVRTGTNVANHATDE